MLSLSLAAELHDAGVRWDPGPGDRFTIRQPELFGDIFTVSEMTIQVLEHATGTVLGFNGTTEWALDSVTKDEALWLPSEQQLRALLGGTFVSLRATASGFAVTTRVSGSRRGAAVPAEAARAEEEHFEAEHFEAEQAEDAYARALLALVHSATR